MSKLIDFLFPDKNLCSLNKIKFSRRLHLLDIGARGGVDWPWSIFNKDSISLILVEPDPIEAEKLKRNVKNQEGVVLPYALWREKSTLTLNLNKSPGTSSVYKSNKQFLEQFPDSERFDAKETMKIETKTIDNLASLSEMPQVDFAKIDVQGAELAILEGGHNHFKNELIGLEVEVEFAELYSGQPLFSDVEGFVRNELGLELWDLKKTYWKYNEGKHIPGSIKGRLVFGDALFLRPILGLDKWLESMTEDKASEKLAMLIITSISYGYLDYATTLLKADSLIKYLDKELIDNFKQAVKNLSGGFRPFRYGNTLIYMGLDALARAFKPTHKGWASIGRRLGSRRRGWTWF